jgi:ABC-type nitrate/sulfonate/bicarbonate transport system substrate-binding protein
VVVSALAAVAVACGAGGGAAGSKPSVPAAATQPPAAQAPAAQAPAAPAKPAPSAPAAPPPVEQIKVSFAADGAIYAPHFIAVEKGYYQEEGIEMEMVRAGGGVATPALISGEFQYSTSAATALSAAIKGAPLKIIYTNSDRPNYDLWSTNPDIKSLSDIVGKSVGVQSRGDTSEIVARIVLQQRGIDPNSVAYAILGNGPQLMGAVQAGSVDTVVLPYNFAVELQQFAPRGTRLVDIRSEVRMLYTGVATNDSELSQHRERARRFLRGTIRGREYYKAFKDETVEMLGKYNGLSRVANEADYDDNLTTMTDDGTMPAEVQQRDAVVRAALNEVEQYPPVEQMYDYSLSREIYQVLRASGWQPSR